jgi:hypothetical protein
MTPSRRHFLRTAAHPWPRPAARALRAPLVAGPGRPGRAGRAVVQRRQHRRLPALVCLFMNGGNDSHNWVVPVDASGYAEYTAARRELAWPLPAAAITAASQGAGRSFGMPPELAPLRNWYEAGRRRAGQRRPAAAAHHQGRLPGRPRPAAQALLAQRPAVDLAVLFPEGAPSGWGGRMGDLLMSANQHPVFTAVSATGNAVFLSGSRSCSTRWATTARWRSRPAGRLAVRLQDGSSRCPGTQPGRCRQHAVLHANTAR